MRKVTDLKGFTLIEILIVIGLIAVLAAVTIIALNPTDSFKKQRDSERNTEMAQIHTALNRYVVDGNTVAGLVACSGTAPNITAIPLPTVVAANATLTSGGYIGTLPKDPGSSALDYTICSSGNAITLVAPQVETGVGYARIYMTR